MAFGDPGGPSSGDMGGGSGGGRGGGFMGSVDTGGTRGGNSGGGGLGVAGGVSAAGIAGAQGVASGLGNATEGAFESSAKAAARSFMDSMDTGRRGLAVDLGESTIGLSPDQMNERFSGLPSAIQRDADPGLIGRGLSLAAGLWGSPVAGLAVGTGARALDASKQIGQVNDDFGTTFNEGFGNSLGQQVKGAVGGFAGRTVGQRVGGLLGRSLGPVGQGVGMLAGNTLGNQYGREIAMNVPQASSLSTVGPSSPSQGDMGRDPSRIGQEIVDSRANLEVTPERAETSFPIGQVNNYGSYAESMFA